MHPFQYCIHLCALDTDWLTLYAICVTQGFKVKFEFAAIVIYYMLTTWVPTEPGHIHQGANNDRWFVKQGTFGVECADEPLNPPVPEGMADSSTTSNSMILSQLVAGSIIVRHETSISLILSFESVWPNGAHT
jgi:hypothetical protein